MTINEIRTKTMPRLQVNSKSIDNRSIVSILISLVVVQYYTYPYVQNHHILARIKLLPSYKMFVKVNHNESRERSYLKDLGLSEIWPHINYMERNILCQSNISFATTISN